jgi:hypothetical protein
MLVRSKQPQASAALRTTHRKVGLTIPITSATIIPPASLRSDHLIGIRQNADRFPSGTLIDFPRIRNAFVNAVLHPPAPNEAARKAAQRYGRRMVR